MFAFAPYVGEEPTCGRKQGMENTFEKCLGAPLQRVLVCVCALKLMKTLHDEVSHALIIGLIIQVHSEKGPARSFCL